ncbi:MAG: COG4223 family protein, partial [Bosea sp. (in: a-proteobacteria)]
AEAMAAKTSAEIAALGQRVAAQPQGAAASPETTARIAEANRQIIDLTTRLGKAEEATKTVAQDAAKQATALATEQAQKIASSQDAAASVPARLVLAERIQKAIGAGQPFASDLKALASLAPAGAGSMAALEAVSAKGAPTQGALLEQFRQVRGKLSEDTTAASASLTERLMAMADNIVKVRAVGAAAGTSPGALTQSIEIALSKGDMAAGLAALAQLPEPARRAGEALAGNMKLRLEAEVLARKLADDAVSALGAAK